MQENHLKPNEEEFQDNSQDLINASLLFARALGLILKENEGIVVDVVGGIKLGEEVKKVIVFKFENQVHIYKCDEDIPEGNAVNMDTSAAKEEQE
jgi:pheromone shutdown protein TraB